MKNIIKVTTKTSIGLLLIVMTLFSAQLVQAQGKVKKAGAGGNKGAAAANKSKP